MTFGARTCASLPRITTRPRSPSSSTPNCPKTGSNTPATRCSSPSGPTHLRSPRSPRSPPAGRAGPAVPARVVGALRARFWDGDEELADGIEAMLGRQPSSLNAIDIDLELFADPLTEPPGNLGYL